MEIVFTKHAIKKKEILVELGWDIDLGLLKDVLAKPDFKNKTKGGQDSAVKALDSRHSLRVVYKIEGVIIKVITFHVAAKGRYEQK